MGKMIDGWLLAIQFFTMLPFQKEVPFSEDRIKWLVRLLPFIGLVSGIFAFIQFYVLTEWTTVSYLFLAIWLLFFYIAFSGGIHLDGWMDCSDAYFSYRDKEKKLVIMADPRVGAFAVISVFFLLLFRLLFIYESLVTPSFHYLFLLVIPFLSRFGMGCLLINTELAKKSGLAFEFKKFLSHKDLWFYVMNWVCISILVVIFTPNFAYLYLLLNVLALLFYFVTRRFLKKIFGGITGDTLGAYVEGKETFLWAILWLLL